MEGVRRSPLLWLIAFRIFNALLISTYFQADEYFQSLEPAWQIAFGDHSGAWITWEWRRRLRSSIHPYMFAIAYKSADIISRTLGWDRTLWLCISPKLMQACIAAAMDYFTYLFAAKHSPPGSSVPKYTILLMVFSPWQWFVSTRTLINSLECTLTAAALYWWPWDLLVEPRARPEQQANLRKSLISAAVACVLRAPNVVIWITVASTCVVSAWIFGSRVLTTRLRMLISEAACWGLAVLTVSAIIDRRYYGVWTLPPFNFLRYNLVHDLAVHYGQNRRDYYLTEGIPILLTTAIPFALHGVYRALRKYLVMRAPWPPIPHQVDAIRDMSLVSATVVTVAALSMILHKEARFIYPLLPMLTWFAAHSAYELCRFDELFRFRMRKRHFFVVLLIAVDIVLAGYLTLYHQSGVIKVTEHLRNEHNRYEKAGNPAISGSTPMSVGFLMPCHSTPWRSHLIHTDIYAWALTCDPPLDLTPKERLGYVDEADQFYNDPVPWLQQNMEPLSSLQVQKRNTTRGSDGRRQWPNYLVFFEALEPTMKEYLKNTPYTNRSNLFNSHWHDDRRRRGDVLVWRLVTESERAVST